jgi:hypothetical protein
MSDIHHPQAINQFLDLEAREDDASDEEDGEDHGDSTSFSILIYGMVSYTYESLARDFIDDGPTLKAQLPTPWRRFGNVDDNLRDSGWDDVVASLEERYTSQGSSSTHRITEDITEKRLLDPEIITAIDNITRLPTDDCPLWRIRCKVFVSCIIFQNFSFLPSDGLAWL